MDVSLGIICALPAVEESTFEVRPWGCVSLRVTRLCTARCHYAVTTLAHPGLLSRFDAFRHAILSFNKTSPTLTLRGVLLFRCFSMVREEVVGVVLRQYVYVRIRFSLAVPFWGKFTQI